MVSKSGQFYLIAALVFSLVILGLITVSNYSKKIPNAGIEDLKEEIQTESAYVLDYGIKNEFSDDEIYGIVNEFTQAYIDSEQGTKDFYFVFGTSDNLTVKGYQATDKEVIIESGTVEATITSFEGEFNGGIDPDGTDIILSIDSATYSFQLNAGYNFYFVVYETIDSNVYIVTNALGGQGTGVGSEIGEDDDGDDEELLTERIVFVTSAATSNGNIGGISGADAFCQSNADGAGSTLQGLKFVAWLSNDTLDARDRIPSGEENIPFVKNDGLETIIANNLNDLTDGTLDSQIDYNEVGSSVTNQEVWTGTKSDGTRSTRGTCSNWLSGSSSDDAEVGGTLFSDSQWTESEQDHCATNNKRLYCIQVSGI